MLQAYRKLKETFADFSKPDGDKETPAKTCRDLWAAHPDKPSGEVSATTVSIMTLSKMKLAFANDTFSIKTLSKMTLAFANDTFSIMTLSIRTLSQMKLRAL